MIDNIGTRADPTHSTFPVNYTTIMAYLKQLVNSRGLIYFGDVTTYTSLTSLASTTLAGVEDGFFIGWTLYVIRDDGGAGAAPQGERCTVSAYTSTTGTFTISSLTIAAAAGDQIMLVHPMLSDAFNARGGTPTIASLSSDNEALLDYALYPTVSLVMTGAEQTLYEVTDATAVKDFLGGYIDFTGLNAGAGEDTTIKAYLKLDGTNYRIFYSEIFLAAGVPSPALVAIPRSAATQVTPGTVAHYQNLKITAQQAAVGGGWNTLKYNFIDGARGS